MTKIRDLVQIKTGYARYVNLVQTFEDPTENRARMEQYMPVASHRQAFERLTRALYPLDGRVYLLTGSYGTGKSHLCLMLANYLTLKPTDREMVAFFQNWARRDATGAERVRDLRGEGRYLVAVCEYGVGDDFDSMVLRAIDRACEREGIQEAWLDTEYHEAMRCIERWEAQAQAGAATAPVFRAFQDELQRRYPAWTLDSLKADLARYSQEARGIFKEVYRSVVGNDFSYSKDNLVQILTDLLGGAAFRARYVGLAVLADEFGDILDRGAVRVATFQRFAEMCENEVSGSRLLFVGTAHKPFQAYSSALSAADFRVAADRVTEVALESEGLEDIIGAIVIPDKDHRIWQAEVATRAGLFTRLALASRNARIFPHLAGPDLRERICEDIFPMHPMATHCVIKLSKEVGSNARSVFTFFSGAFSPGDGSYPCYVAETDVVTGDRLNLYTADLLTTYFRSELRPESSDVREAVRQHIRNYRASLREVQKQAAARLDGAVDPLVQRILDLMLVYEIAEVTITVENLAFGLYCEEDAERARVESRLAALVADRALYRSTTGLYEFRRSEAADFEAMVEEYKANPANLPADLAQEVLTLVPLGRVEQWLEAKNYNAPFDEDKRLLRVLVRPDDLETPHLYEGQPVSLFTQCEREMQAVSAWKDRYEGAAIYVLCETDEEVQRARRLAEGNTSRKVIVGIPREPIPLREAVMNLRAVLHIQGTVDLDSMSLQDRSRLQQDLIGDETKGYKGQFLQARKQYLSGRALTWYAAAGRVLVAQPSNDYEPADELMRSLFTKHNPFPHPQLNPIHVGRFGPGVDVPLDDAVEVLLDTQRPVEIDHGASANRGEIRFLKRCLADQGALVQQGPYHGSLASYQVETNVERFRTRLPALAGLMDRLRALGHGQSVPVRELVHDLAGEPFGQGPVSTSLYLAFALRTFGDELRLQQQPGAVGWVAVRTGEQVCELVLGRPPNAVLERVAIGPPARALINGIFEQFSTEPGAFGQQHSISEAHACLRAWWLALPNLARALELYPTDEYPTAHALVDLLSRIDTLNPYAFVLQDLQVAYGYDTQAALTDTSQSKILAGLRADKVAIEGRPGLLKDALLTRLVAPFAPAGNLYGDYQSAIEIWYRGLSDAQQDPYSGWHSHQSQAIVQLLRTITSIETTFFERLPAHAGFGLGRVDDWRRDQTAEYLRMFTDALEHVEAHRIVVASPKWEVRGGGAEVQPIRGGAQIAFRRSVTLTVQVPEPGVVVYLTDSGEDPCEAQVQRQRIDGRFDLAVSRGCNVRVVSQAQDGSYGPVTKLSFVNDDDPYRVRAVTQQTLMREEFEFVFPKDREALVVTLRSLLEEAVHRGLVGRDGLKQLVEELVDSSGHSDPRTPI